MTLQDTFLIISYRLDLTNHILKIFNFSIEKIISKRIKSKRQQF